MKALLICPDPRPAVAHLARSCPLAVAPLLGKCLAEYWIEYLGAIGVREITIAASDRPADVAARVGDGTRWGLSITVREETSELSTDEAAQKYSPPPQDPPAFIVRMNHLPGQPGHSLFESYGTWFASLHAWMPRAQTLERIGQYELRPGVWVGLRAQIHPAAALLAPCWLGDYVSVQGDAVIGPGAILEDGVVVGPGARIAQSVVGPATFVGAQTRVENSLADRDTLINWTTNSSLRVPDASWLSSLREPLPPPRPAKRVHSMKIENDCGKLGITGLTELSTANSRQFRDAILAAFSYKLVTIEIDLSEVEFVDRCGLATLCGVYRSAVALGISVRLLNPSPPVRQLLELTQLGSLFEVGRPEPAPLRAARPQPAVLPLTAVLSR